MIGEKRKMKKISGIMIAVFLMLSMVLAACSSNTTSNSSSNDNGQKQSSGESNKDTGKKKFRIAFVPGITTDAFYISMKYGAEDMANKLGVDLIWQGAPEWDYTKQTPIIESMVAEGVDAIITAPTDSKAMIAPLKKAKDAGIPVFTIDTNVSDESIYVSNVTSDNKEGGALAADELAKLIGEKGKVALINTKPGITTTDDRQKGFLEQIKKYPNIKVAATEYSDDQATVAAQKIQDILLNNSDLAGVFATNVVTGSGVSQGLRTKNKTGKVKLIAYDSGPEEVKALKAGEIQALISQKPLEEATQAMQMAYDYLNGKKDVQKQVQLTNITVTPDNVDQEDVKKWLYRQ
jgi:ribose transport system substrate-binding protein